MSAWPAGWLHRHPTLQQEELFNYFSFMFQSTNHAGAAAITGQREKAIMTVSDTVLLFPNPALRSPPKPLCERLNRSPMTSPEKMAASFKNAERLRAAHLDGVVEKAAREGRAVENVRQNLEMRLADARDKLERRLDADSTRVSARKDEKQAKMQQAKDKVRVPPCPPPCSL